MGYWATDTQTLYRATGATTWEIFYTPYTYPHPLGVDDMASKNTIVTLVASEMAKDFTVATSPASITVDPGGTATVYVKVGVTGGYAGDLNLSVSGLPGGCTSSFSRSTISAPGASILKIVTPENLSPGSTDITVTADEG